MTDTTPLTHDAPLPKPFRIKATLAHSFHRDREAALDVDLEQLSPEARASATAFFREEAWPGADGLTLLHWSYNPQEREDQVSGWTVDTLDLRTVDRVLIQMRAEKQQADQDARESILVSALQSDSIWVEGRIGTGLIARELAPAVRADAEALIAWQGGRRELDLCDRYFNELDGQCFESPLKVERLDAATIAASLQRMAARTRDAYAEEASYREWVAAQDPTGRAWTVSMYRPDGHTQDRFTVGHSTLPPAAQDAALYLSQHTPMPSGALHLARYETTDLDVFTRDGFYRQREWVVADLLIPGPRASDIGFFLPDTAETHRQARQAMQEAPEPDRYTEESRREHATLRRRRLGQGLG